MFVGELLNNSVVLDQGLTDLVSGFFKNNPSVIAAEKQVFVANVIRIYRDETVDQLRILLERLKQVSNLQQSNHSEEVILLNQKLIIYLILKKQES